MVVPLVPLPSISPPAPALPVYSETSGSLPTSNSSSNMIPEAPIVPRRSGGGSSKTNTSSGTFKLPLEITRVFTQDGSIILHPNYTGEEIQLTIVGNFEGISRSSEIELVLDNAIKLRVASSSENEIIAFLPQKGIPDLYLTGTHKLEARFNNQVARFELEIGPPERPYPISPKIDFIDLEYSSDFRPIALKIQGSDLMLNPFFAQIKLDDAVLNIFSTEISSEFTVVRVTLPNDFDAKKDYGLVYSSPFGSTTHLINGEI